MKEVSIKKKIEDEVRKKSAADIKKIEAEKDEIKQLKLAYKIARTTFGVLLENIKSMKESQWQQFQEELNEPIEKQSISLENQLDLLAFQKYQTPEEYKLYEKTKKVEHEELSKLLNMIDEANLNKKQLERYLVILFRGMFENEITQVQNLVNYFEFNDARNIVHKRLGYDYDWLVCMSLIQLHENLIKKRLSELGEKIERRENLEELISRLTSKIKQEQNRDVTTKLELSKGIKKLRDLMTHEGYKHSVSKEDLKILHKAIQELESTLYPESQK